MVEWNLCGYFKEAKQMSDIPWEEEFYSVLTTFPDHSGLARYVEPHLLLIKSQHLTAFYYDLRYHKGTYLQYVPLLIHDAVIDYRLRRLLEQCLTFMKRSIPT